MNESRSTATQLNNTLREQQNMLTRSKRSREYGISQAVFRNWKSMCSQWTPINSSGSKSRKQRYRTTIMPVNMVALRKAAALNHNPHSA